MLFSNTQSVFLGGFENDTFLFSKDESTVLAGRPQLPGSHPARFLAVSQHWEYTLESNNHSMMEVGQTGFSLCVELHNRTRHYEPRCSMRWSLVRWSKHSASFRKFSCLRQELTVVMNQNPKSLTRWLWKWNILAFTGWPQSFCQPSPVGKFTLNVFPCRVPELRLYTWNQQNFSMKEVMWTGFSLCGDFQNHMMLFDPRLF